MGEIEKCIKKRQALPAHEQKDDALAIILKAAADGEG